MENWPLARFSVTLHSFKMAATEDHKRKEKEKLIIAAAATVIIFNKTSTRTQWVREWVKRRQSLGAFASLMQELAAEDPKSFKQCVRMTVGQFDELRGMVDGRIRRQDTVMRQSIKPEERLAVTLRFLGSGHSFSDLELFFRIPRNTIREIVLDTCSAIYDVLKDEYMKVPSSTEEWQQTAREFEHRWNLPNCIGALDGKHNHIKSPGGSMYYNYMEYHSIILLALVDAKYRFLYVDVGANGRAGDAGVFRDSNLAYALEHNTLRIPDDTPLPGRTKELPFFIVGDDAFPLKSYLMKPFPFRKVMNNLHDAAEEDERRKQRIFTYRLPRARRLSENAFGVLATRFQVFYTAMRLSPEHATTVTRAAIALHNFLMTKRDQAFVPNGYIDREDPQTRANTPGEWRFMSQQNTLDNIQIAPANRYGKKAAEIRDEIKEYVNNEGQVPWQENLVFGNMARM